jgi:hypothetical protein
MGFLLPFLKDPDGTLAILMLVAKGGLMLLIAISWLVGWMREPDPKKRFYALIAALGRVSLVTFQNAPGSSKLPLANWRPKETAAVPSKETPA